MVKGGGLIYFDFCIQRGAYCRIGEGLKREGAKYRNYCTSIPFFPNMLQEGGLQGLNHGFQGQCIACYVPGNME
jgi:hypothetical protein